MSQIVDGLGGDAADIVRDIGAEEILKATWDDHDEESQSDISNAGCYFAQESDKDASSHPEPQSKDEV